MKQKRDFKGVWFPRELYLTPKFTITEKFLLAEINSLDGEEGCFASNKHFAEFLSLSIGHISNMISSLRKKGVIIDDNSSDKRILHIKDPSMLGWSAHHVKMDIYSNILSNTHITSNTKVLEGNHSTSETASKHKKYFPPDSIPYALADYQLNSVLDIVPNFRGKDWREGSKYREKTLQSWSIIHDKILRLDKRNPDEVMDIMDFIAKDSFWCSNVLSAGKLRDQYDKLLLQMKKKKEDLSTRRTTPLKDPDPELTEEIIRKYSKLIGAPKYSPTPERKNKFIQATQKMIEFFSTSKGRIPKTAWVDYLMECLQKEYGDKDITIHPGKLCSDCTWENLMYQHLKCLGVWYE